MLKTCKSCRGTFDAETHFYRARNVKSGFRNTCKACDNESRREWRRHHPALDLIVQPAARALYAAGFDIAYIAEDLGRTRGSVKAYIESLSSEKLPDRLSL